MGEEPHGIRCEDIDGDAFYICEVEAFEGGAPATGCERPSIGLGHGICPGGALVNWVCGGRDCTDGFVLLFGWGTCQRLIKVFGPYIDAQDAGNHMW